MDKIQIQPISTSGEPIWSHLNPLLEYAIKQGCTFKSATIERPFGATPNGDSCHMIGDVSMEELSAKFELPPTIQFSGPNKSCLWDKRNNITFCIYRS